MTRPWPRSGTFGATRLGVLFLGVALLVLGADCARADVRGVVPRGVVARGVTLAVQDASGQRLELYRGGSYALVIGASAYQDWPTLPGVADDLEAVQAALRRYGFQVTVVTDPDRVELRQAYEEFINTHGSGVDNRLLLYFAGHGQTLKLAWGADMGYIVPVDAPRPDADPSGFRAAALDMEQFQVYARRIQSKHALFLFDSCFSGSLFNLSRGVPEHISYKTALPVRQFITSGSADEKVPDQSIFRRQLLEGLDGEADQNPRDGYVTGAELGEFLKAKVARYSRGAQHPQSGTILDPRLDKGDFVFALAEPPSLPPTPAPAPPSGVDPLAVELAHWRGAERCGSEACYRDYLARYPQGQFAVLARERLRPPVAPPAAPVTTPPAPAWLTVRSNVAGDTWYLDGQPIGPTSPIAHEVAAGTHSVRVEKPGHAPYEEQVALAPGERLTVRAELAPALAPPGARAEPSVAPGPLEPEMVLVRGGRFTMGSPETEEGRDKDERQHTVKVGDFYLGRHEVTVGEFRRFVEASGYRSEAERTARGCFVQSGSEWKIEPGRSWRAPGFEQGEDHPVACLSWNDALAYTEWLAKTSGRRYRLPTEAEWEYAARAGTSTARFWGEDPREACRYANVADRATRGADGWVTIHECDDGEVHTAPAGSYQPNPWGLYDLLGNVWEWTCSSYSEAYDGSESQCADGSAGGLRSFRGGCWNTEPGGVRSAGRSWNFPVIGFGGLGFRLARTP
jgi:formylglycine-generating enzyme required for sulfatase activity/uncharacterized caspase-like protein